MNTKPVLSMSQEMLGLYYLVGLSVTQWAYVEEAVYWVAACALESPEHAPFAAAFFSIENFRSKLGFADRAMQHSATLSAFYPEWVGLRDTVSGLAAKRNALAHGRVKHFPDAPAGRRSAILPPIGRSRGRNSNPQRPPVGSLCVKDIDLIRLQFSKAHVGLSSLHARMGGGDDVFGEYAQQEPKPQTLAQLRLHILAMSGPHG